MPTNIKDCPDSQTLEDFMLGKLPSSDSEDCREHLIECDPCVETIRGLKVDGDTLNDLSREAWLSSAGQNELKSESQVVNDLMQRMEGLSVQDPTKRLSRYDVTEDRAAEVQRLLEPAIADSELGRLGKYRIVELLGAGSTGVVYQAIDADLDRTVALKILRPSLGESARERFLAEAKATAKLNHPNIVSIYEVGIKGPLAFISMNWESGQTLEQLLAKTENLTVAQTRTLGIQLAEALSQAHQLGLIHRDIKPANVWIPDESGVGGCKILDFGLVRITDEDPQLTCTGMIAGTPCYMSPEQSRGQQLDGRSDLFSLGCMLYQTLIGRLPFRSDNALSTLQSIQRDQPTSPIEMDPSVPQDLSDLVMCLLEKSPNRRPPTAASVAFAFSNERKKWPFEVKLSTPVKTNLDSEQPTLKPENRTWKLIAAMLTGFAIGVFGLMYGPEITRIVTNQGVIEINSKVDDVKIEIKGDGDKVQIIDLATKQSINLTAGAYEIRPLGEQNSIQIDNNKLILSRGETEIVTITRTENPNTVAGGNDLLRKNMDPDFGNSQPLDPTPHLIAPGDVLGIFIAGVVGKFDASPPIHMPAAGSGDKPTLGFPILVLEDGTISLPFIKPLKVEGKTPAQARQLITVAYEIGDNPILKKGESGVFVNMMRKRSKIRFGPSHRFDTGDVLGIFIAGILGDFEGSPPVHFPTPDTGLPPSLGYPVEVDEKGRIHIPYIDPINVRGKTISGIKQAIEDACFSGEEPPLEKGRTIIFVSMMRTNSLPTPIAFEKLNSQRNNTTEPNSVVPTSFASPLVDTALYSRLKQDLETQRELFAKKRIDAKELYVTEAKLLEFESNTNIKAGNGYQETLKRLLEIRKSQYEIAMLELNAPTRPGNTEQLNNNDLFESRDKARKALGAIRKRLRAFESHPTTKRQSTLPIYKNRTYEECLAVTQTEYDFTVLVPALEGLITLADEIDHAEVVETMMQVIRRKKTFVKNDTQRQFNDLRKKYFWTLSLDQATDLICNEFMVGNEDSINALANEVVGLYIQKPITNESDQRIFHAIAARVDSNDASEVNSSLIHFLLQLSKANSQYGKKDMDYSPVRKFVLDGFEDSTGYTHNVRRELIARTAPDAPGFIESLDSEWRGGLRDEESFRKLAETTRAVPDEHAIKLVPAVYQAWYKNIDSDARRNPTEMISFFRRFPKACKDYVPAFESAMQTNSYNEYVELINAIKASLKEQKK